MTHAYICDAIRTPFGRYGGALSSVRTDDLGAVPMRALMARNPKVDWQAVGDVLYGCANQAGEDNRNVARMALLLAGLPATVPGLTAYILSKTASERAAREWVQRAAATSSSAASTRRWCWGRCGAATTRRRCRWCNSC